MGGSHSSLVSQDCIERCENLGVNLYKNLVGCFGSFTPQLQVKCLWGVPFRGGRSHFFRLRLLFQNIWIRVHKFIKFENPTPVQTPATIIDPTVVYPCFHLRYDHTDSSTPAPCIHGYLWCRPRHPASMATSGVDPGTLHPWLPLVSTPAPCIHGYLW